MNIQIMLSAEDVRYLKARLQNHESEEPEDPQHARCRERIWNTLPNLDELRGFYREGTNPADTDFS